MLVPVNDIAHSYSVNFPLKVLLGVDLSVALIEPKTDCYL